MDTIIREFTKEAQTRIPDGWGVYLHHVDVRRIDYPKGEAVVTLDMPFVVRMARTGEGYVRVEPID